MPEPAYLSAEYILSLIAQDAAQRELARKWVGDKHGGATCVTQRRRSAARADAVRDPRPDCVPRHA